MERDRGLAGAGPAGHHEDPGERRPDGFVLLGLDGGDDVAHAAGALAVDGGQERALAHHREPGLLGGVGVEHLVVEPEQAAAPGLEVAAPGDAHGVDGGRAVERLGDRGPPVDDQRHEVVVVHRDAADVERAVGLVGGLREHVEAPEAQRGVADVEARRAGGGCRPRRRHAPGGPGGCRPAARRNSPRPPARPPGAWSRGGRRQRRCAAARPPIPGRHVGSETGPVSVKSAPSGSWGLTSLGDRARPSSSWPGRRVRSAGGG